MQMKSSFYCSLQEGKDKSSRIGKTFLKARLAQLANYGDIFHLLLLEV